VQNQATPTRTLAEALREALTGIEGVTLLDKPHYYAVKAGSATLAYVTGSKKPRVSQARRGSDKPKALVVTKLSEIAKAVALVKATPTRKPATAQATKAGTAPKRKPATKRKAA